MRRDGEIKEGRRWRETGKMKRGKEGITPGRRVPVVVCCATCKCNSVRNICNGMRPDILENPRIYSGACDAATMEYGYIVFIPHHVCAYMKLTALPHSFYPRSRITGSPQSVNLRDENSNLRG